jgi:diguanylate cyclase (GGDEF)-like protein/PAS domain S-box-containing protein
MRMIIDNLMPDVGPPLPIPASQEAEKLRLTDKLLIQTIMNNSQDTIYFKDVHSRFVLNSQAHARQFGLEDPRDMMGKTDFDYFPELFARQALLEEQEIMRSGQPQIAHIEKWEASADKIIWFSASKYPLYDEYGCIVGTWGTSRDITDLKLAEEELALANKKLETLSKIDELSGLYNRRSFYELLKKAARHYHYKEKQGLENSFCLIELDIDRFKTVNDTHGHLHGDNAIRHIAHLLTKYSRSTDTVFRVGGDEYAVLLLDTDLPSARLQADYLRKNIEASPMSLQHEDKIGLTVSMGVSCYRDHMDIRKMIHDADMNLYQSKNMGRNLVNG